MSLFLPNFFHQFLVRFQFGWHIFFFGYAPVYVCVFCVFFLFDLLFVWVCNLFFLCFSFIQLLLFIYFHSLCAWVCVYFFFNWKSNMLLSYEPQQYISIFFDRVNSFCLNLQCNTKAAVILLIIAYFVKLIYYFLHLQIQIETLIKSEPAITQNSCDVIRYSPVLKFCLIFMNRMQILYSYS